MTSFLGVVSGRLPDCPEAAGYLQLSPLLCSRG